MDYTYICFERRNVYVDSNTNSFYTAVEDSVVTSD